MANIFIIHGSYGNPTENWFPWLKEQLEKKGHTVFVPVFPTPENQSLQSWLQTFKPYEAQLTENSLLIGHSLGPAFILALLEQKKAKASFFVAPFISSLGNETFDKVNKTFYKEFSWGNIKKNCSYFYIFHGDNDPYVPYRKTEEVAHHLGVGVISVKNAGHFNKSAGYTEFPLLLKYIRQES